MQKGGMENNSKKKLKKKDDRMKEGKRGRISNTKGNFWKGKDSLRR